MQQNYFYRKAFKEGASNLNKRRIFRLLSQLSTKLSGSRWSGEQWRVMKDRFQILGRFLQASITGHYKGYSPQSLIIAMAALIYFINPMDLIPDFVPLTGYTDDFGILMMVYSNLRGEIDKFVAWENTQTA